MCAACFFFQKKGKFMKNKFLMLFLVIMMILSLVACGKETNSNTYEEDVKVSEDGTSVVQSGDKDAKSEQLDANTIEEALKNMNAASSMEMQVIMAQDTIIELQGINPVSVEGVTTWNMVNFYDTPKFKMDITMDMGEAGIQESRSYVETSEDGRITIYTYAEGQWQSEVISEAEQKTYDAREIMNRYITDMGDINNYQKEGMEAINGANAYKYSCILTGEKIKALMAMSGSMETASSIGITESQLDDMIEDLGEVIVYVWIDEETLYPVKYEVDLTEFTNALTVKASEALDSGLIMRKTKDTTSITCFNYNNAADFTIPDEARQIN